MNLWFDVYAWLVWDIRIIRWGVELDYNNNRLLAVYVLLMLYYVYVIVIYDWYLREGYVKYSERRRISNAHENMANIMSTGCGRAWWLI